jgi:hypothetical protein
MPQRYDARNLFRRWRPGLGRHLVLLLVLKAILLAGLWQVFVKPCRVAINSDTMGARVAGSTNQTNRENSHDRFDGR